MDIGSLTGQIKIEDQLTGKLTMMAISVKKFAEDVDGSFGAIAISAGVMAAAVGGAFTSVIALGMKGSTLQGVEDSFNRLAISAGTTGDALRGSLSEGVKSTVSEMTLMQSTMRLMSSGMKLSTDDARIMGEAARAMGKATGTDAANGLSTLSSALLTGRTRSLAMAGIVVDLKKAQEDFARSIGTTASELNAEGVLEAKRIAILAATQAYVERMGVSELTFKERLQQAQVAMDEWSVSLAKSVASSPHVLAAYDAIEAGIKKAFGGDSQALLTKILGWINTFADAVSRYAPPIIQFTADVVHGFMEIGNAVLKAVEPIGTALVAAFSQVSQALVDTFGGGKASLVEVIVGWVQKFGEVVAAYTPPIVSALADIVAWVIKIAGEVRDAWDLVPDWMKRIAEQAAITGVAVYGLSKAFGVLGGDNLSTAANISQIASGVELLGRGASNATPYVKDLVIALNGLLLFNVGAFFTSIGTGLASLGSWFMGAETAGAGFAGALSSVGATALSIATAPLTVLIATIASVWGAWKIGQTEFSKNAISSYVLTSDDWTAALIRLAMGIKQTTPEIAKFANEGARSAENYTALAGALDLATKKLPKLPVYPGAGPLPIPELPPGPIRPPSNAPGTTTPDLRTDYVKNLDAETDALVKSLAGGGKAIAIFQDAFSKLSAEQLLDYNVLQKLIPEFDKLTAAGIPLSNSQQAARDRAEEVRVAFIAEQETMLKGQGITQAYIDQQVSEGKTLQAIAAQHGVSTEALKSYQDHMKDVQSVKTLEGALGGLKNAIGIVDNSDIEFAGHWSDTLKQLYMVEHSIPPTTAGFYGLGDSINSAGKKSTEIDGLTDALKKYDTTIGDTIENQQKQADITERTFNEMAKSGKYSAEVIRAEWEKMYAQQTAMHKTWVSSFMGGISDLAASFTQLAQSAGGTGFGEFAKAMGETYNSVTLAYKAMEKLDETWAGMNENVKNADGTTSKLIGLGEGVAKMASSVITAIAAMDAATSHSSAWQNIVGGASTGASIGSDPRLLAATSGWSAAVGAGVGALIGWLRSSAESAKQAKAAFIGVEDQLGSLLTAQEKIEASVAPDAKWAGSVLALRDTYMLLGQDAATAMQLAGQQMQFLAQAAADGPELLAEAIAATQDWMTKASERVTAAMTDMGLAGQNANRLISKETQDTIALLTKMGLKTTEIAAFYKQMGSQAITGFNQMVASIRQSEPEWQRLKDVVDTTWKAINTPTLNIHDQLAPPPTAPGVPSRVGASVTDLDALRQAYADLGIVIDDDTLKLLDLQNQALDANAQTKTAINTVIGGLLNQMAALSNSGKMTEGIFSGQESTAVDLYSRMQAAVAEFGGTSKDALEPLQGYLRQARDEAIRLGTPLNSTLSMLIAQSKELGLWESDEQDKYQEALAAYQTASDTAKKAQDAMASGSQEAIDAYHKAKDAQDAAANAAKDQLETLGRSGVAAFAAAVASGMSWSEAMKAIQPGISELRKAYEDLGLQTENAGLQALFVANTILDNNPDLITAVQGLVGESTALANMGLLNVDTFADMEKTGAATYAQLQAAAAAAGGSTRDALMPMQDWLHQAAAEADQYGFALDENTQRMIDQSKELGIWKDAGATTAGTQTDLFKGILQVLELIGTQLGATIPKNLQDLATASTDSAGKFKNNLDPANQALTGNNNSVTSETDEAAANLKAQLDTASSAASGSLVTNIGAGALKSLTSTTDAGSLTSQATLAGDHVQKYIDEAATSASESLTNADWTTWADNLVEAAHRAQAAIDATLEHHSVPGGIRQIPIELARASRAMDDFALNTATQMDGVRAAVDSAVEHKPGDPDWWLYDPGPQSEEYRRKRLDSSAMVTPGAVTPSGPPPVLHAHLMVDRREIMNVVVPLLPEQLRALGIV